MVTNSSCCWVLLLFFAGEFLLLFSVKPSGPTVVPLTFQQQIGLLHTHTHTFGAYGESYAAHLFPYSIFFLCLLFFSGRGSFYFTGHRHNVTPVAHIILREYTHIWGTSAMNTTFIRYSRMNVSSECFEHQPEQKKKLTIRQNNVYVCIIRNVCAVDVLNGNKWKMLCSERGRKRERENEKKTNEPYGRWFMCKQMAGWKCARELRRKSKKNRANDRYVFHLKYFVYQDNANRSGLASSPYFVVYCFYA